MTPTLAAPLFAVAASPYVVAGPMDAPSDAPRYLDSGQFAALGLIGLVAVFLLAVVAVGTWRR